MKRTLLLLLLAALPLGAAEADLEVTWFNLDALSAVTGQQLEATLRIKNHGPDAARGPSVLVSSTIAPILSVSATGPAGWKCFDGASGCSTESFAAGQEAEFRIVFLAPSAPQSSARFEGSVIAGEDPRPANNRLTHSIPITAATTTADLTLTSTSMFGRVEEGQPVVVEMELRNAGPDAATNARVVAFVSHPFTVKATGAECRELTVSSISCVTASLPAGASSRVTLTATAPNLETRMNFGANAAAERNHDPTPTSAFSSISVGNASSWHRLMIPVTTSHEFQSPWTVDVTMLIRSDHALEIRPHPCEFISITCYIGEPPLRRQFNAYLQTIMPPFESPDDPGAMFLYVRPQDRDKVQINARVYARAARNTTAGSEIPIVHDEEFTRGPVTLLGIPLSPVYRQHLRVYDTRETDETRVSIRIYADSETEPRATELRTLEQLPSTRLTTTARLYTHPGYAQIDLREYATAIAGATTVRIDVDPVTPGSRIWAFVTTTNNETQHVTTTTPQ